MKIPVAVVGATGIAGQQVLAALDNHPYFAIAALAASERSAGRIFADAITDKASGIRRWYVERTEAAGELEPIYAARVPTISTARPHRMEPDIPLVIPGLNLDHLAMIETQKQKRGSKGY